MASPIVIGPASEGLFMRIVSNRQCAPGSRALASVGLAAS